MTPQVTRIWLASITVIFICIGVVMIYSASAMYAFEHLDDSAYYLKRHVVYLAFGLIMAIGAMLMPLEKLRRLAKPLLLGACLLLVLVLVPGIGKTVGGARRWFRFAGISFQPSELAKLAMIIYVSDFMVRKRAYLQSLVHGFLPLLLALMAVCCLIIVQPDLGTVVSLFLVWSILVFVGGVRWTHMVTMGLAALPAFYLLIFNVPYRKARILSFLDPWSDPQGTGFQIIQSLVALGSGGITGVGLGQGKQKLLYLPAAYTDFVVSILGEELGFLGTACLVLLCVAFVWLGTRICLKARNPFAQYLGLGLFTGLMSEALVNLGVVTSLLPTKGLPFPFISYGGSSLVFNMIFVGLLLNVGRD